MGWCDNPRRLTTIIMVVIIVIAVIVIVVLLMRNNGVQPFKRMGNTQLATSKPKLTENKENKNIEKLRNDIAKKDSLDAPQSSTDTRLEAAQVNKKLNTKKTKKSKRESSKTQHSTEAKQASDEQPVLFTGETIWDLLTPKEDTMREYGVTEEEMNRLVEAYRKEHKYTVEKAPTTINFDMERWERATDVMQDSMKHAIVEKKPYEDGLIDALYKEGEL